MKRILSFLLALAAVAAVAVNAAAAEVAVDQHRVLEGMGRSWYQGYQPTVRRGTMTICLPLEIDGGPEKITVAAALDDPNVFLLSETPKEVTAAQSDGIYPVKLQLSLKSNRRDGDYPITITVKNADGGELLGTIPYVIRIRNGYTTHETLEPVLSPVEGQLDAGCEGTLKLTVTNPTTTLSITHCVLTVTDADKEILMTGAGRVEIPEILPGQSQTVTIPVTVKADAAITEHVLEAELSYKVLDKEETWKQSLTVPVNQTIRMEQGGVQLPTAIAGELANMTLPLMNMGKGELSNVLVTLDIDGVVEAQSVLVGAIAPGETKQAKLTFTPGFQTAGTHSGTAAVTCEDAYGNTASQVLPVTLTVDQPLPEVSLPSQEDTRTLPMAVIVPTALCVVLLAALVIQGVTLTSKNKRLEEERL